MLAYCSQGDEKPTNNVLVVWERRDAPSQHQAGTQDDPRRCAEHFDQESLEKERMDLIQKLSQIESGSRLHDDAVRVKLWSSDAKISQ